MLNRSSVYWFSRTQAVANEHVRERVDSVSAHDEIEFHHKVTRVKCERWVYLTCLSLSLHALATGDNRISCVSFNYSPAKGCEERTMKHDSVAVVTCSVSNCVLCIREECIIILHKCTSSGELHEESIHRKWNINSVISGERDGECWITSRFNTIIFIIISVITSLCEEERKN